MLHLDYFCTCRSNVGTGKSPPPLQLAGGRPDETRSLVNAPLPGLLTRSEDRLLAGATHPEGHEAKSLRIVCHYGPCGRLCVRADADKQVEPSTALVQGLRQNHQFTWDHDFLVRIGQQILPDIPMLI